MKMDCKFNVSDFSGDIPTVSLNYRLCCHWSKYIPTYILQEHKVIVTDLLYHLSQGYVLCFEKLGGTWGTLNNTFFWQND